MNYIGDFALGATVYIRLTTATGSGGAVAPSSAFETNDFRIYKNDSETQKATTNGITISSPADLVVGFHWLVIDTSNNTGDAGFWADGSEYCVVAVPDETVDGETVVAVVATFSIGRPLAASRIAAIAAAVVQRTDLDQLADGSFGKLVFNTLNRLPTELEDGRVKATLSEEQIDDIMTAIGSIDQTQYENISGTSGFFFRKLQAGTTPGIPKAF